MGVVPSTSLVTFSKFGVSQGTAAHSSDTEDTTSLISSTSTLPSASSPWVSFAGPVASQALSSGARASPPVPLLHQLLQSHASCSAESSGYPRSASVSPDKL